jgi:HEPN domain-containing protein
VRRTDDFNADVYRRAALERITTAERLLDDGDYVMFYYVAGLAVECMFRAYRYLIDKAFDARHDLRELADASHFLDYLSEAEQEQARAALADVLARWSNSHRYRSYASLRAFLNSAGLYRLAGRTTIRGQVVERNSPYILQGARTLVRIGDERWPN